MPRNQVRAWIGACALALVVACAGIGPQATAQAQAVPPGFADWDKAAIDLEKLHDAVISTIETRFFDEALKRRVDWRARADALRPAVISAPNVADAVRQLNALLAELKTSHTALLTPDEYQYYVLLDIVGAGSTGSEFMARRFWGSGPYYAGIGAFTREVDGRHFVDGVLEASPAARAGLKYGDEILFVDGRPYSPVAAFRDKLGTVVELAIRREANGEPQRLQIAVVAIRPTKAFSDATRASVGVIERDGRRIGYVHVWASHESESLKTALQMLEPSNQAGERLRMLPARSESPAQAITSANVGKPLDFLIVDMRGRVGGTVNVAEAHLEALDARPKPYWGDWRAIGRSGSSPSRPARNPPFRGRSVMLTDHHTRSAGEFTAYGFKHSRFGPVVGTPTAGAVSSGMVALMPGDLLLYVAVAGHEFDGHRLEGVGVIPDHRVERPLPYAAGADPVLDAAVELLVRQELR